MSGYVNILDAMLMSGMFSDVELADYGLCYNKTAPTPPRKAWLDAEEMLEVVQEDEELSQEEEEEEDKSGEQNSDLQESGEEVEPDVSAEVLRFSLTEYETEQELLRRAQDLGISDGIRVHCNGQYFRPMIACKGGVGGKRKGSKKKKKRGRIKPVEYRSNVPRSVMTMADRVRVDLEMVEEFRLNSLGQTRVYASNALYDPYVPLGGPSVTGFNTWVGFYNYYRVTGFTVNVACSNLEVTPVTLFFTHSNVDPGTSISNYFAYGTQAYGFIHQLGPATGMSDFTYKKSLTPRHIVGDRLAITAERYVGSSTANPADLTYFGIAVNDAIGSLANGVQFLCRVRYHCEFFDRKNITDSVFKPAPKTPSAPPVVRISAKN
jgi:hypothetical protein